MHSDLVVAVIILWLQVSLLLWLSWLYFQRYQMTRPPIGVLNLGDVAVIIGGIILLPYLYLYLPRWLVLGLLALGLGSALYFTVEPIVRSSISVWLVTLGLLLLDVGMAWRYGTQSLGFVIVNNIVLLLGSISIGVLWVQSGMKARDVALLAAFLTFYDYLSTSVLPLMDALFVRLANLPFVPALAWPIGQTGQLVSIGVGDLLLATLFPLVLYKAFSRSAGMIALGIEAAVITILLIGAGFDLMGKNFPVMVVLGPLMVLQYLYWRSRKGKERTTLQYKQAEALVRPTTSLGERI